MIYIHVLDEFSFAGGGVRSVVSDLSQEMANRKQNVYIMPLGLPHGDDIDIYAKWAKEKNINFSLLRKEGESLVRAVINFRKILKKLIKEDKCCLYLHLKRGVLVGILASLGLKDIRKIEVYHSNYINYKLQAAVCKHFLDYYLAVSKESYNQLCKKYRINNSKIKYAPNGIDINKALSQVHSIQRDKHCYRLFSIGRLAPPKNFETSIQAYNLFRQANSSINCEYLIAGDGPQRKEFELLANGNINFMGMLKRNEVFSYIASADVVLFPSLWEGLSIALLEVMAIGCPVIVTDIPSFRDVLGFQPLSKDELFRPCSFGAVFHKESIESCMAAIDYMVHNRDFHHSMKCYVSSLVKDYTLQKQTQSYIEAAQF